MTTTMNQLSLECDRFATEAAQLLTIYDRDALIVTSDGHPVGLLSERDLVQRLLAQRKDPLRTTVGELLSLQ